MIKQPDAIISPEFFIELRDLQDFIAEFGPFNGRYAADYPSKEWLTKCLAHVSSLKPVEQLGAKRIIDQSLKHGLLQCSESNKSYCFEKSWDDNARCLEMKNFNYMVGNCIEDPKPPFKRWVHALEDIRNNRRRRWNIRGTYSDYMEAFRPMLVKAPAIYIVDAYCCVLNDDIFTLMKGIFEEVKGSCCREVHVITRDWPQALGEKKLSEFEVSVKVTYEALLPKNLSLLIHLVDDRKNDGQSLRLHTRYFLTRFGALDLGVGIKLLDHKNPQTPVTVVDENSHKQLVENYIRGVSQFDHKHKLRKGAAYPSNVHMVKVCSQRIIL